MEFSKEDLQYIVNAIDTHIRANGLAVASKGVMLVTNIQADLKAKKVETPDDK